MTMTQTLMPGSRIVLARWLPLLAVFAALCLLLAPGQARANAVCSVTSEGIAFGTSSTATGSVSYTCTNSNNSSITFTLCLGIGNPSPPGTASQPVMRSGGNTLDFNLYTNASRTIVWRTSTPISASITVPRGRRRSGGSISGTLYFYGLIPSGQGAAAGSYSAQFSNTTLGRLSGATCQTSGGSGSNAVSGQKFTLHVQATVANNCTVTANGPASFGTVPSSATNLTASTSIGVDCPNGTAYRIGLAPSNGNAAGAGVLTGTGGNTDHPPYQLRSASSSGPIWGNTATATSTGNGVAGTGNGSTQTFSIYVTALSANYTPDSYSDTVTVNLNF